MRAMGMDAIGIAVLHRESGKEFGLCRDHESSLDDAGVVHIGPIFGEDFVCVTCSYERS